jgi:leucyl-tRNA---protein transferase
MIGTPDTEPVIINEYFQAGALMPPEDYDYFLEHGWRHYAGHFCRYNFGDHDGRVYRVLPLRVKLDEFALSKSQRRIMRRNADVESTIGYRHIDDTINELFDAHKRRFTFRAPESIYEHVSWQGIVPTYTWQLTMRVGGVVKAASFFDCGDRSVSSIYTCFDPAETKRSLGILAILKTIEWGRRLGKAYYYPGYAYEEKSFYDYKKRIGSLEVYDWRGSWQPYEG